MIRGLMLLGLMLTVFFSGLLLLVTQTHWITLPVFCLMAAVLPQTSGDMRLHFFALSVLSLASVLLFL